MITPPSQVIWQVAAQVRRPCLKIENCGGSFPMKGIQPSTNSTKISDVSNMFYYSLVKKPWKKWRSLPSWWWCACGSWVSVCHPPAVVLHGRLIALAHSARYFALALVDTQFQSVPLFPRPKKTKCSTQLAVLIWKTKNLVQGEFNPSLPRPSTASRPPSSSNPASCRRRSFHANQDCAVVWLVVAPASAHEHPD